MPAISPKLGEFLINTTKAKDIDDAFHKIFLEYLELKLKSLDEKNLEFQNKWEMNFDKFKKNLKERKLHNIYSFEIEKDFWEWEKAETLKKHYEDIRRQWI